MKITDIRATRSELRFVVEGDIKSVKIVERVPVVGGQKGRILDELRAEARQGEVVIPRFSGKHDRLTSRFEVYCAGDKTDGVCYVTDLAGDLADNREAYPQPDTIKAMSGCTPEDASRLGIRQALCNINLLQLMTTEPDVDDIAYEHDGHTYYFVRSQVEAFDKEILSSTERGIITTLILLNSPHGFGCTGKDKRCQQDSDKRVHVELLLIFIPLAAEICDDIGQDKKDGKNDRPHPYIIRQSDVKKREEQDGRYRQNKKGPDDFD